MSKQTPAQDAEAEVSNHSKAEELLAHPSYEELMKQLNEVESKANEHWDRLVRLQADNENLKRRAERDVASAHKYALEKFVLALLPIIDSLELCLTTVNNGNADIQKNAASVVEGVDLTLKMFYTSIEKFGINQINPINETFDPEFQQAISVEESTEHKSGIVLKVLQKGYTLNNRLLRPALVIVAK